jgi:nucleotide-binding universal stress UspA family protein
MLPIRTILVPTDFSEHATYGFRLACAVARDYDARVVLLHVVTPPPIAVYGEGVLPPEPAEPPDRLREQLREIMEREPEVATEPQLAEGDAAAEIVRAAGEFGCDLIVMGTHGRTGLGRLLMGSVAEQVVRKAPCPVLTLKSPHVRAAAFAGAQEKGVPAAT